MPPRPRLSRHAVLDAALTTIDRVGLHGLSVRTLAKEVGVAPMTLYSHFGSKSELLDLTFERLLDRLVPPHHGSTWQVEFREVCGHMRGVLLEHPRWIDLLTRTVVPSSTLTFYERLLHLMWRDGFLPEAGMLAFSSAMSFVLGSVLVERMMDGHPPVPLRRLSLIKDAIEHLPRARHPRAVATAPKFERWTFDAVFELGLQSLVEGLEAQCAGRRAVHPRAAK